MPSQLPTTQPAETSDAQFDFGENWARFLTVLDSDRITEAERSIMNMLGVDSLSGMTFLDVGCGSGLLSLAAARLGADRVHSLDVNPTSVACAQQLRAQQAPKADGSWSVEQASALDVDHLRSLGTWDVVYSWGVLHHTGRMWDALANVVGLVAPGGQLFISIYNDQGMPSRIWRLIKRTFNRLPQPLRVPYAVLVMAPIEAIRLLRIGPRTYVQTWTAYKRERGMSRWHDLLDWVGGYPYEVATPDEIFDFFRSRGFVLERLVTRQGTGCNEFVFRRSASDS
jgi:2-polyprenyl-3-methyl-5-hydroxy-6-metoxy-1,4-benzoquinol methylase